MIKLCEERFCTGCESCVNICPNKCINMKINTEGFYYPSIDNIKCIKCKMCMKACPELNKNILSRDPYGQKVYALISNSEKVLMNSSSGGAFYELAKCTLEEDGVIFGAAYNENMEVKHISISNINDLYKLQGSKYVQSCIGNTYKDSKRYLKDGKKVLFTGTPCQIGGLYAYLGRDYENLVTCDLLCKGVPSPGLFKKYILFLEGKKNISIEDLNFRSKDYGWGLLTKISGEKKEYILKGVDDTFVRTAGMGMVRKSCFYCKYTKQDRVSDITLGDFWRIGENKYYKNNIEKGCSVILANTKKSETILQKVANNVDMEIRDIQEVINGQSSSLTAPIKEPVIRSEFFRDVWNVSYETLAKKYLLDKSLKARIRRCVPRKIDKFIAKNLKKLK